MGNCTKRGQKVDKNGQFVDDGSGFVLKLVSRDGVVGSRRFRWHFEGENLAIQWYWADFEMRVLTGIRGRGSGENTFAMKSVRNG